MPPLLNKLSTRIRPFESISSTFARCLIFGVFCAIADTLHYNFFSKWNRVRLRQGPQNRILAGLRVRAIAICQVDDAVRLVILRRLQRGDEVCSAAALELG